MLDITEIESGTVLSVEEDVDLAILVLTAAELFTPMAHEKHIGLTVHVPEKMHITGDLRKVQRIVSNFLDNAIKYTREGGEIVLTIVSDKDEVRIRFKDTGIGIASTDLPHIFERFYRCDSSRSEQGVGLGLSLAKALTESMGGYIDVNSTVNEGSIFTVNLPKHISPTGHDEGKTATKRASDSISS